jgi:hypothetical protein
VPEILEKRCGKAKSGLMLAPANAQAVSAIFPHIVKFLKVLSPE